MPRDTKRTSKIVSIRVPNEFELPQFYDAAEPCEIAAALTIGASIYEAGKVTQASEELRVLEEKKNIELQKLREVSSAEIRVLQSQVNDVELARALLQKEHNKRCTELLEAQKLSETNVRKEERELVSKQLESRIKNLESEISLLNERNAALSERKSQLETSRDTDIKVAEERTRILLQSTLDEKERAVQRSEKMLSSIQESYCRQLDEIRTLGDLIRRKPTNVKVKGSEYEEIFRIKLVAAFGNGDKFSLIDTARNGIGHAGDYLMKWGDHTIMWEVKNYDKPVPTAEVEKFRRDMKENANVRVGVMVSRYTPIVGKTSHGDREIEFISGKMLIYLSNFETMSDDMLPSLMLLFRLWWESDKNTEDDESKMNVIYQIEKLHSAALKSKNEWRLHRSRGEEMLRWMASVVEENEERLDSALKAIRGHGAIAIEKPEGIFRDVHGDEKLNGWIALILEFTSASAGEDCVMNELADLVAKKKAITRDTAKSHIRSVLLDSSIEPPKGKTPAKIKGLALKSLLSAAPENTLI